MNIFVNVCASASALTYVYIYTQAGNKIMETLRNFGIEFVLVTLKKLELATLNILTFVYTL
jgi:hypothetical protein